MIGVSTDAKRYTWQLGRRHGKASSPVLRLQAPTTRGRYTLTVSERGHVEPRGGVRAVIGLAHLGGPIACLGLALLLVAKTQRERIAGLGFAAFGTCVLCAAVAPHRPVELLGGFFGALGIGLGLALAFRRWPWLFPVLALASVPVRIGVHVGQSSTKLLVPLYIVILGGAILLGWDLIAGDRRVRELRAAAWPLAAYLAWVGLSISWSRDVNEGAVELLAFYVPFTLLAICIARLPWSTIGLRTLYVEITVMAVAFSAVGFYQYDTRNIFQNPKLGVSNAYAPFFRVNSVFWDPSVYGRFLVLAMAPSILARRARAIAPLVAARRRRARRHLARPADLVLAVELRGAARRRDRRGLRRLALARARCGRARVRRARGNRRCSAADPALAAAPHDERAEQRLERPGEPRRQRDPDREGASGARCRRGRLQTRVR